MRRAPLLLCALGFACSKPADAPREDPPVASAPGAPDGKPTGKPTNDPSRLLIADIGGLHEYDLDGNRLTTLSEGAAESPRVLPDGRVVFLRSAAKLELWMHTPGGETKRIAELPQRWNGETCKAEVAEVGEGTLPLKLEVSGDFRLDATKHEACIRLQDRSDSVASLRVAVWVDLAEGKLRQQAMLDRDGECASGEQPNYCHDLPLERPRPSTAPPTEFAYAYDPETGKLTGPGGSTASICRGYGRVCAKVEQRSPTGRFELLTGEMDTGDEFYRKLIVFDRQTGMLRTIGDGTPNERYTPVELFAVDAEAMFDGPNDRWDPIPGDCDIRWLQSDRLWLCGYLIDLSEPSLVPVGGDLAFRLDP